MEPGMIKHFELLGSSIGVIIGLFFGLFLLITKSQRPLANIFLSIFLIAFSLRLGKSLFHNYFEISAGIRNFFLSGLLAFGPSLWFYIKQTYKPQLKIYKKDIVIHFSIAIVFMILSGVIPNNQSAIARWIFLGLLIHMLVYSFYSMLWLSLNIKLVKNEPFSPLRKWLFFISSIGMLLAVFSMSVFWGWIPYLSTAYLFSVSMLLMAGWALKNPQIFKNPERKYEASSLSETEASNYLDKIEKLMADEKLFLDPNLTLTGLSKKIGITSKLLSQVINQKKKENYSQYISRQRIKEAKKMLIAKEYEHLKIAAIAFECGFNSISSFNTAFKKFNNSTAQQFRNSGKK